MRTGTVARMEAATALDLGGIVQVLGNSHEELAQEED